MTRIRPEISDRTSQTVLDVFTEWKTLYIDYSGRLQKAQIDIG